MSEPFDPYHTWLGISPHEQPVHFYRLLGIGLFESDPAVIAGAADRQMAYVRSFQAGPRGAHTQKLLNELARARHSLLDAKERANYDAWLRQVLGSGVPLGMTRPAPPQAVVAPPASGNPTAPPVSPPLGQPRLPVGKPVAARPPQEETEPAPSGGAWFWVLAGLVGLLSASAIAALVLVLLMRRGQEPAPAEKPPLESPPLVEKPVEPETPAAPKIVETEQEGNGDVELVASAAERLGEAELVDQDGVSAIDGLYGSTDKLRWNFRLAKPGFFRVLVSYAAETESAGGRYRISVGDKSVSASVRESGAAKQVSQENIGILVVQKSGRHTLEFAPLAVNGKRLMHLHSIRLVMRP